MKKVLILEDNFATAEYLKALINEIDIKALIFAFPHPAEGYRCALENDIDLFIVDIILDTGKPADSSGLKFVSQIRKMGKYSFTPVIFVTALEDSRLYTYEELHCYRFFEKPFDARELQEEIRYCLTYSGVKPKKKRLYYRKEGIIISLKQEEIVYAESSCQFLLLYLNNRKKVSLPYITLKRFLADAEHKDFIQCSRRAVIALEYVDNVDFSNGIISLNDRMYRVEIGMRYKKILKDIFR